MKKLFSSLVSVFTSAALLSGAALPAVSAEEGTEVLMDYGQITLGDAMQFSANYSENGYNYGVYLDENNVEFYKAFIQLINPSTSTITVKLPEPVSATLSTNSPSAMTEADQLAYEEALYKACRAGIDTALFDMPDIFWLDLTKTGIGSQYSSSRDRKTGTYTITIQNITLSPDYFDSFSSMDEVMEYKAKLEDAVANFPVEGDTRYDQLKSIHDYICNFTYYDINSPFYSSALGSLVEPGAVCESYSEGFKLICDSLGIPCVEVIGNFNADNTEAHMWNYVQMEDGKWYAVDVTWDDRDGRYGVDYTYDYFLKGSGSFFSNHTPEADYGTTHFYYPELSETDYVPGQTIVSTTTTTTSTTTTTTTTTTSRTTTSKTTTSTTTTAKPTTTTTTSTTTSTTTTSETTSTSTTTKRPEPTTTTTSATTTYSASSTTTTVTSTEPPTTTTVPEPVTGDVNNDGNLGISDLVYCMKVVLGDEIPLSTCDVDGDGRINSFDVGFIRRLLILGWK